MVSCMITHERETPVRKEAEEQYLKMGWLLNSGACHNAMTCKYLYLQN